MRRHSVTAARACTLHLRRSNRVGADKFDVAESHFDSAMQRLLPPKALEDAWKLRTDPLGDLKTWRIVGRSEPSFQRPCLHGARDYHVVDGDIDYWRTGLKGTPGVTIETIAKLNHLFIAGSGQPGPDEYSAGLCRPGGGRDNIVIHQAVENLLRHWRRVEQAGGFVEAEHQVHVLNRLARPRPCRGCRSR